MEAFGIGTKDLESHGWHKYLMVGNNVSRWKSSGTDEGEVEVAAGGANEEDDDDSSAIFCDGIIIGCVALWLMLLVLLVRVVLRVKALLIGVGLIDSLLLVE